MAVEQDVYPDDGDNARFHFVWWLYNGAPLVVFYDTLGIRRTYSRLKPRRPHGDFEVGVQSAQVGESSG